MLHVTYDQPIYIITDASRTAAGWMLEQYDADGRPRIVALGGARIKVKTYSTFELEMLALKAYEADTRRV